MDSPEESRGEFASRQRFENRRKLARSLLLPLGFTAIFGLMAGGAYATPWVARLLATASGLSFAWFLFMLVRWKWKQLIGWLWERFVPDIDK